MTYFKTGKMLCKKLFAFKRLNTTLACFKCQVCAGQYMWFYYEVYYSRNARKFPAQKNFHFHSVEIHAFQKNVSRFIIHH